jgi:hypothetical protein
MGMMFCRGCGKEIHESALANIEYFTSRYAYVLDSLFTLASQRLY